MYESHFGITGPPFQLNPDPSFYFDSKGHHQALAEIRRGLAEPTGFLIVSGEIGAGKTTLVRTLLEEIDASRFALGHVLNTQLDAAELLRSILLAFGVPAQGDANQAQQIAALNSQVTALANDGWRAVLIIDEAQNLHLDAFQLLIEMDREGGPSRVPLKVFLVGQPELRTMVDTPELRALRERTHVACHLGPLDAAETGRYIEHRLTRVGWSGVPTFEPGAFTEIHRWTNGVPRRINLLCNRLMLSRFLGAETAIDAATVAATARDLRAEVGDTGAEPPPVQTAQPTVAPTPRVETVERISLPMPLDDLPAPAVADAPVDALSDIPVPAEPRVAEPAQTAPSLAPAPVPAPASAAAAESAARSAEPEPGATAKAPNQRRGDRRRAAPVTTPLPPMAARGDGSGPLLCMLDSDADHIKASALLAALANHPALPATLLVCIGAGDALARNGELFPGFDRSRLIPLVIDEGTAVGRAAELMRRFEFVVDHCEPAAVVLFDASEVALHAGLVARSKGVPVVHIGAGLRLRDDAAHADAPRRITDHLADLLYTAEADAGDALVREGVAAERTCFVGNLQIDALQAALRLPFDADAAAAELGDAWHYMSDAHGYGLVVLDQSANIGDRRAFTDLVSIVRQVSRDLPLVWPMHPRTREQLARFRLDTYLAGERIACLPTQPYAVYARLLSNATCALSDSWTVQEEAAALSLPCLTMGDEPARPMAAGLGSAVAVGRNKSLATRAVWECIFNGGKRGRVPERWDGRTAERLAAHLAAWLGAAHTTHLGAGR